VLTGVQEDSAGRQAGEVEATHHLGRQQEARRRAEVDDRVGADAVARVRFVEDDIHGRVAGPVGQL